MRATRRTCILTELMKKLPGITLLGIDYVYVKRLQKALDISSRAIEFAHVKLLTSLPTDDPRRVEIPHIGSVEAYSEFCIRNLRDMSIPGTCS